MSVSSSAMHFREKRASELDLIAKLLDKYFSGLIATYPIYKAINQLREISYIPALKDGSTNPNCWGYEIEEFRIPVETTRHVRPQNIKQVELILTMKLVADFKEWESLSDPLCELHFNVIIRGIAEKTCYSGFHLDRHNDKLLSHEPHPIYHLQYSSNPYHDPAFDYGGTLYLDTPRIMHYPMDFILGMGFLTSNYAPKIFNQLLEDGTFTNLYKLYQEKLWKPVAHSLADHWPYNKGEIIWKPTSVICPYII